MEFDCLVGRPCGIDVNYVIESICPAITACGMIILQSGNLTIPQAVGHRTIGLVETFTIPELVSPWQVHTM